MTAANHVGRFAPSPTCPLRFGSLVAVVVSYCDAKANSERLTGLAKSFNIKVR